MKMRNEIVVALILLTSFTGLAQNKRPMTLKDVLEIKNVGSPKISPDGKNILYTLTYTDMDENKVQSEIWLVSANGTNPRKFTSGNNDRSPQWSPNGKWVAFLSDRTTGQQSSNDNSENQQQIYLISPHGGEAMKLTSSKTGAGRFSWSNDSTSIAYTAQVPLTDKEEKRRKNRDDAIVIDANHRYSSLNIVDIDSKRSKEILRGNFVVSEPAWSPDSKQIAYTVRPTPKADDRSLSDIYILNTDGSGTPQKLYENEGSDTNAIWTPDGKRILFNTRPGSQGSVGFSRLHTIPANGGQPRSLIPDFDGPVNNVRFSPDGKTIYFQAGQGTTRQIFNASATGGDFKQITDYEAVVSAYSVAEDGKTFSFTKTDLQEPTNLYVASLPAFDPVKVADHNPQLENIAMGKSEIIQWESQDGTEIEGILIYPINFDPDKKYPVLMNVHGGPSGAWTQSFPGRWSNYAHVWAGKNWVTLLPNPRGSSNYGEEFQMSNFKDWGGGDYNDVQTGLDELIRRGIADPNRMGQTGWSYGGYMTAWTLTQTDRFKAVMVGAGLTNMFSMYSTNDLQRVLEGYFGDTPFDNEEEYRRASAMTFINKAKTPTLIMHGEQDQRVPKSQAQELYMGLKKNNVPVEMIWYPREPHGLREPRHQLDKMRREYAFFSKNVLNSEVVDEKTDREEVLDVIENLFAYLAEQDGERLKDLFWPGAMIVSDRKSEAGRNQEFILANDWADSVTSGTEPINENISNPTIQIHHNIAAVWARFSLTVGDYVAEGIDAFHLIKKGRKWRIMSVVYTHDPKR